MTRLLANFGVAGSTPLLARFSMPVGGSAGESLVRNGDFSGDADNDGMPDAWLFSSNAKQATCRRERTHNESDSVSLVLVCPATKGDKKSSTMLAQHDVPVKKGQWYRISFRAKAERLAAGSATVAISNMANWRALFDYQRFTPGPEWQQFSFEGQSKDTAQRQTRLQIWYSDAGTLWLSDVQVTPINDPTQGRWLDGFYMDKPEAWDDPYRFFRW